MRTIILFYVFYLLGGLLLFGQNERYSRVNGILFEGVPTAEIVPPIYDEEGMLRYNNETKRFVFNNGISYVSIGADGYLSAVDFSNNTLTFTVLGQPTLTADLSTLGVANGDYGDITVSGSTWTINPSAISDDQTASQVNISDVGQYFTGTEVESALQELGQIVGGYFVSLNSSDNEAPENGDTMNFNVQLNKANTTGSDIAVRVALSGTATFGVDYSATDFVGTTADINIPNGSTFTNFTITATEDATYEGNELIIVSLRSSPTGAYLISETNVAIGTIIDNDVPVGGVADNLGNHTATQNLDMNDNEITAARAIGTEGLTIYQSNTTTSNFSIVSTSAITQLASANAPTDTGIYNINNNDGSHELLGDVNIVGAFTVNGSPVSGGSSNATAISITDIGGYFNGDNVELALQEMGADITTLQGGGADGNDFVTSGTYNAGDITLTVTNQPNVVVDVNALLDNTDTQDLSLTGNSIALTDGGSVDISTATAVVANSAKVTESTTVTDTPEINLTLTGTSISAAVVANSIDETKLDASVNTSLNLADTALQSEVDGSITNEIQSVETLSLTGTTLNLGLTNDGVTNSTVDLETVDTSLAKTDLNLFENVSRNVNFGLSNSSLNFNTYQGTPVGLMDETTFRYVNFGNIQSGEVINFVDPFRIYNNGISVGTTVSNPVEGTIIWDGPTEELRLYHDSAWEIIYDDQIALNADDQTASEVNYSNAGTNLTATTVQTAITELDTKSTQSFTQAEWDALSPAQQAAVTNAIIYDPVATITPVISGASANMIITAQSVDWTGQEANTMLLTLTTDVTINNPSNPQTGAIYQFIITQDAGGLNTLSWGNQFAFPDGIVPTVTLDGGAVDIFTAYYTGSVFLVTSVQNFLTP